MTDVLAPGQRYRCVAAKLHDYRERDRKIE